jgi:starvation-inducible DNA-binding protein
MRGLEQTTHSELTHCLQEQLANAFVLYANYKTYHWETYGPLFRDMHLLFDEHGSAVLATVDELAERIRMLGDHPIADFRTLADKASVKASTATTMSQMIREAEVAEGHVVAQLREAIRIADGNGDPGSADLFTRVLQVHEKHLWFLRQTSKREERLSIA